VPLLEHIFADWGPEVAAYAAHFNRWVQANPSLPAGHLLSQSQERRVHPSLGEVTFDLRDVSMRRHCAPQALWHFDKAASLARGLAGASRDRWHSLMQRTGGEPVMAIALARPIAHCNNVLALA